jgi:cob(I)alamin adenosyltransferase
MVILSRIYTRTGDAGYTRLANGARVAKTDSRIQAVGDISEANAQLGIVRTLNPPPETDRLLDRLQQELFDVGADIATPLPEDGVADKLERINPVQVSQLEAECDRRADIVGVVKSFVIPGGAHPLPAHLHLANTVMRRAERSAWRCAEVYGVGTPGGVNHGALAYLNRVSDLLFLMARQATDPVEEEVWIGPIEPELD